VNWEATVWGLPGGEPAMKVTAASDEMKILPDDPARTDPSRVVSTASWTN
jgi:hypothetical protein